MVPYIYYSFRLIDICTIFLDTGYGMEEIFEMTKGFVIFSGSVQFWTMVDKAVCTTKLW